MTTFTATAEGGTNGNNVLTTDTGSGQPFDARSVGTGAAFTYSNSGNCRRNGAGLCYSFSVGASSVTARVTWNVNGGASAADQWYQMYLDPADLSSTCILGRGMDSTSVTQRWRIRFQSSTIILADQSTATVATSSALSNGTRYRVLWRVAGSSSGACRLWVFIGDSLTATYDSGEVTGKNFSGVIQTVHWGIAASATSQNGKIDDAVFSDVGDPGPSTKTLAAAAMTGTSTVSASTKVSVNVSAALSGALSMAATARVSVAVAAALSGAASLSAALKQVAHVAPGALVGSGSVGATVTKTIPLGAVLTASGTLQAVAVVSVQLSADLSGVAALTVDLTTIRNFSPTAPRAGSITVPRTGVVTQPGEREEVGMDELSTYDPFATAEDYATKVRRTLSEIETASIEQELAAASLLIRQTCGWQIWPALADDELTLDGKGGSQLLLPVNHVTAVTTVTEAGTELTADSDYEWSEVGILTRLPDPQAWWPKRRRNVVVTLDHGYTNVPTTLVDLCLGMAGRVFTSPRGEIRSQAGLVAVTFSQTGGAGSGQMGITPFEERSLRPFMAASR